jgi:hypothetical protein
MYIRKRKYKEVPELIEKEWNLKPSMITSHIFILKQQKRLSQVKRIINFAEADGSREEYFSRPV